MPTLEGDSVASERARICVLVPTYRRLSDLRRCLAALRRQERPADQVLIVCRDSDAETAAYFDNFDKASLHLEVVTVSRAGLVAALNAGLARVEADVVAITDDDSAPRIDWLARIERHFAADARVGGVGGRDYISGGPSESEKRRVGIMQWFGRPIGNHHRGVGCARNVQILKGVNMSYRMSAVKGHTFDERLRGKGAQVHNDLAFSLMMNARGWRLVYDPAVAVDHFPAQRFDEHQRSVRTPQTVEDRAFNETLAILEYLAWYRRPFFWIWAIGVGTREVPGLLQCVRFPQSHPPSWKLLRFAVLGRFAAYKVAGSKNALRERATRIAKG